MATIVKFYKDGKNVKDITSIGYLPVDEDAVKDSRRLASSGRVIAAAALAKIPVSWGGTMAEEP